MRAGLLNQSPSQRRVILEHKEVDLHWHFMVILALPTVKEQANNREQFELRMPQMPLPSVKKKSKPRLAKAKIETSTPPPRLNAAGPSSDPSREQREADIPQMPPPPQRLQGGGDGYLAPGGSNIQHHGDQKYYDYAANQRNKPAEGLSPSNPRPPANRPVVLPEGEGTSRPPQSGGHSKKWGSGTFGNQQRRDLEVARLLARAFLDELELD